LYHFGGCRADVYKRIYQVLFYGNGVGKQDTQKPPTLIFPLELREEIRIRFSTTPAGTNDEAFDSKPGSFAVTWDHIREAKWPSPPKSCHQCKPASRAKPY
jgi:hypothetical protein